MKKLNKKDWIIFWLFATLLANVVGNFFNYRINTLLRHLSNPWLTSLNEPQSYGRLIAAAILLALLILAVLFYLRKSTKAKIAALLAGLLVPALLAGIYSLHCRLIVSVLWDEQPNMVSVDSNDTSYYVKVNTANGVKIPSGQALLEILELCRSLTPITDEAKISECMDWYENAEDPFLHTDRVSLYFPEKYGHNYQFTLRLREGYVYLWRGHDSALEITFFEDNGITEWAEKYAASGLGKLE